MANEFHPTGSKEFFVGREDNIDVFHEIWSGKRTEWIIYVLGIGGIGKTRLLLDFCTLKTDTPSGPNLAFSTPDG